MKNFILLENILSRVVSRIGVREQIDKAKVCQVFNQIVKEKNSLKEVKALYLKNKTLFVKVKNSFQSQEIKLEQKEILDKINKEMKKDIVENLSFIILNECQI